MKHTQVTFIDSRKSEYGQRQVDSKKAFDKPQSN